MSTTPISLDAAREVRAQKKAAARRATLAWQDAVLDDLRALMAALGVVGTDPVAVFYGAENSDAVEDAWFEEAAELRQVAFAASGRTTTLTAASAVPAVWAATVEMWDELRQALSLAYSCAVPVGLVLDVNDRVLAGHEQWYCPGIGPEPQLMLELERHDEDPKDPFELMLASADAMTLGRAQEHRLLALLGRYGLSAPTEPGHEPGECDIDPGLLGGS